MPDPVPPVPEEPTERIRSAVSYWGEAGSTGTYQADEVDYGKIDVSILRDVRLLIARLASEVEARRRIRAFVDEQAEDEGLWFMAQTAPEAYLQQELRRLHSVIEDLTSP